MQITFNKRTVIDFCASHSFHKQVQGSTKALNEGEEDVEEKMFEWGLRCGASSFHGMERRGGGAGPRTAWASPRAVL